MKAVVVLTTNSSGQVLFGKRSDRDEWSSVAGHLRDGEDPVRGATRCLMEQTKLSPAGLTQLDTKSLGDTELYTFKAHVQGEPTPGDDFSEFKWVDSSQEAPDGAESWSRHAFKEAFGKSEDFVKRAVVVLTVNSDNRLLFGKRRDNERWSSIAGHLNADEDPAHGAVRELFEEARLVPNALIPLGKRQVGSTEVHVFKARVDGNPSNDHDPDKEFSEMKWVDITAGIPKDMELHGPADKDQNAVTSVFGLEKSELADLAKKIADFSPGKSVALPDKEQSVSYDYSHLLSPESQKGGYKMRVVHRPNQPKDLPSFKAEIFHLPTSKSKPVGRVSAYINKDKKSIQAHSELHADHRSQGKGMPNKFGVGGLGVNMYEALYNLAQKKGITHSEGWFHSDAAKRVHESLARRHGLKYNPEKLNSESLKLDDYPHAPYRYKIK